MYPFSETKYFCYYWFCLLCTIPCQCCVINFCEKKNQISALHTRVWCYLAAEKPYIAYADFQNGHIKVLYLQNMSSVVKRSRIIGVRMSEEIMKIAEELGTVKIQYRYPAGCAVVCLIQCPSTFCR